MKLVDVPISCVGAALLIAGIALMIDHSLIGGVLVGFGYAIAYWRGGWHR